MSRAQAGALARKLYQDEIRPVPHPRRKRKGWLRLAAAGIWVLGSMTVLILVYLSLCTRIVEEQYALDRYETMLPSIREENAWLEFQTKELSSLARIDRIARTQLHMREPRERVMLEEVPQDADAAESAPIYAWKGILQKIGMP